MSLDLGPDLALAPAPAPAAVAPAAASQGAATQEVAQTQAASLNLSLRNPRGRMIRVIGTVLYVHQAQTLKTCFIHI